jgi:hypothetical protein
MNEEMRASVRDYYARVLQTNDDLKTSACCPAERPSPYVQRLLKNVHETVVAKFYGCGSPLPVATRGRTVLCCGNSTLTACFDREQHRPFISLCWDRSLAIFMPGLHALASQWRVLSFSLARACVAYQHRDYFLAPGFRCAALSGRG